MASQKNTPNAPVVSGNEAEHRRQIAERANRSVPDPLETYTVSDLPDPGNRERSLIYVSDETGGATLAFSDGSDWRRVQDRAIVS